jgi:hypothetical protein
MSETPETDELDDALRHEYYAHAFAGVYDRMHEHARQLERQRDEAVRLRAEEIAEFNAGCDAYKNGGYAWAAFDDLRKQRDEAVALLRGFVDHYKDRRQMLGNGYAYTHFTQARQFLATLDRTEKT